MPHAPLPPSAAKRWLTCPGSFRLTAGLESPDSVYSREGTFGHERAAECLRLGVEAKAIRGFTDGEFVFDGELLDAVQTYLDVVRFVDMREDAPMLLIEHPVKVTPRCYGTLDAAVVSKRPNGLVHVDVFDLKLGRGIVVAAEQNEQLLTYACGVLADLGRAPNHVDGITLHIVQPRVQGLDAHRQWTATPSELRDHLQRIQDAEVAVDRPDAPLVAGSHCGFCPARETCPALQAQALAVAQECFPDLDAGKPVAPAGIESVSDERLGQVLAGAEIAQQWIAAVRKAAFERAARGAKIPGWKLVEKIGNRRWTDEKEAAAVLRAFSVDPYSHEILSPAQAEKACPAAEKRLAKLTVRPVTGMSLVPDSDRRPALADPSKAFDSLGE